MKLRLPVLMAVILGGLLASSSGILYACNASGNGVSQGQITVPKAGLGGWEKDSYAVDLLYLVLARTEEEFGPCSLAFSDQRMTRMRSAALISSNRGVDLFWATTSIERETILRPIRIPIFKGLMSYKILLIRSDAVAEFSKVKNLPDLQALSAGQGSDWPDTRILQSNGIKVVTSSNYDSLPRMLTADRFDFFPRGANEVLTELAQVADLPIVLEKKLVLIYPAPVYFFVNMENLLLAKRIETGLQMMIEDGSFDDFFNSHPTIVQALHQLEVNQRRAIYLNNPLLPPSAPLGVDEYWLFPWGKLLNH
jgi:hypothetical protein